MLSKTDLKIHDKVQRVMGDDIDMLSVLGAILCDTTPMLLSMSTKSVIMTMVKKNKLIIVERDT